MDGRAIDSCSCIMAASLLASLTFVAAEAQAFLPFTEELCAGYSGQMVRNVQAVGLNGISSEFKASNVAFLGPNRDCSGPAKLVVVTPRDASILEATRRDVIRATGGQVVNGLLVGGIDIYRYIQIEDRRR